MSGEGDKCPVIRAVGRGSFVDRRVSWSRYRCDVVDLVTDELRIVAPSSHCVCLPCQLLTTAATQIILMTQPAYPVPLKTKKPHEVD